MTGSSLTSHPADPNRNSLFLFSKADVQRREKKTLVRVQKPIDVELPLLVSGISASADRNQRGLPVHKEAKPKCPPER